MGGEDSYDFRVPFDTIVKKGALVGEIEERKQTLVEQCRTNNGLTLQEVIDHNDWLLQVERDLSKARSRIERDFRISYALSLKVREGKRKAQLQQRIDTLMAQCEVLNHCIISLSDHCSWFQESGTYREAVEFLDNRWGDEDEALGILEDARLDLLHQAGSAEARVDSLAAEVNSWQPKEGAHHDLDGLIYGDGAPSLQEKNKRRKRKKRKGGAAGNEDTMDGRAEHSEEEKDGDLHGADGADPDFGLVPEVSWMRAQGNEQSTDYVSVWAPD
eukprot:TRINITY_DN33669_c0_g1_i1.p1 TRINITY_DN33669_c0_g1~~TRINITY_DN33669_c0_g1_i1.p1  ORF type:complete len:273 (+),score=72.55 TRINITY_DN33669_c0_g1_i1:51-869(+)